MIQQKSFFLVCLLFFACNRPVHHSKSAIVETLATVLDMRNLDGCTFLFITDEGKKLLPYKLENLPFALKDKQRVGLSFSKKENVDGICMAEDMIIEIHNIKLLESLPKPAKKTCSDILDPVETEWSKNIMVSQDVTKMWKFKYQDGFAYYLIGKSKNLLFDCQGNKMCEDIAKEQKCIDHISELSEGKIVWVLNQ